MESVLYPTPGPEAAEAVATVEMAEAPAILLRIAMLPAAAEAAATAETAETEAAQAVLEAAEAAATVETVETAQAAAVVDFSPTAQMALVMVVAAVEVSSLTLPGVREPMAEC